MNEAVRHLDGTSPSSAARTVALTGSRRWPHYEVVVGINRDKRLILTLDPANGPRVNSREGFTAEWTAAGQVTMIVMPKASAAPLAAAQSADGEVRAAR